MIKTSTVFVSDKFPEGVGRLERYEGYAPIRAFTFPWDRGAGFRGATEACLTASPVAFYALFTAEDADLVSLVTKDKGSVFEDDCLEVFLMPEDGRYYGFEINPNGALLDYRVGLREDGSLEFDYAYRSQAGRIARVTENGWTAEFSIPFADLGRPAPVIGETWRCSLNRIDRGIGRDPAYASWCDFPGDRPNFHQPLFFNELRFAPAGEVTKCA